MHLHSLQVLSRRSDGGADGRDELCDEVYCQGLFQPGSARGQPQEARPDSEIKAGEGKAECAKEGQWMRERELWGEKMRKNRKG